MIGKTNAILSASKPTNYIALPYVVSGNNLCKASFLPTELTLDLTDSAVTSLSQAFNAQYVDRGRTLQKLTIIGSTGNITSFEQFLQYQSALVEIIGALDFSSVSGNYALNGTFSQCGALKEIRFVAGSIPKTLSINNSSLLSDNSIQSIIDGLKDMTGATAQTLYLHSTVKAKLTEEQTAAITAKNWNLA